MIASVNGRELEAVDVEQLHPSGYELDPGETARSLMLIIVHDEFLAGSQAQFGIAPSPAAVAEAFDRRTAAFGDEIEEQLAAMGVTTTRVMFESELDVLRTLVEAELVRTESPGFDIDRAYRTYLMNHATVCLKIIRLAEPDDFEEAQGRIESGEDFADVAAEMSIDPNVTRPEGEVGSGGDYGCGAPAANLPEIANASLDASLGRPTGPFETASGSHLLLVYEREEPRFDEVRDEAVELAIVDQGPDLFTQWGARLLQAAEVVIDESYGVWGFLPESGEVPMVVPTDREPVVVRQPVEEE